MIVPARALDEQRVEPGERFDVVVVLDAPQSSKAGVSLHETLPPGFTITGFSAEDRPRYDGGVWTWRPWSYKAGDDLKVRYTVKVGQGVAAGTYEIAGLVRNDATRTERRIAGAGAITVASD